MSAVLDSRAVAPHTQFNCPKCSAHIEYATAAAERLVAPIQVRCCSCSAVVSPPSTSASSAPKPARKRKIGTQERPLETVYYDVLGLPVDATTDDIKRSYRRLALKLHPDKNRDDPEAEERFKTLAVAYQTLSDPDLRRKYNELGPKDSAPDGGYVDPEEVFSAIFGGERFVPIIGQISLAQDMKTAMQEQEDDDEPSAPGTSNAVANSPKVLSPEAKAKKELKAKAVSAERAKIREKRVALLVDNLDRKLSIFTESATGVDDLEVTNSWRSICQLEAQELKRESYGVELLHAIGFVYTAKAREFLATSQTWMGVGGWLHNVQGKYHVFSETVSTLRSAMEVKNVFDQITAAEKAGVTPEERKKLEEQAAEKGLQALFKGTKLEVESILRETCDRILEQPGTPLLKLKLRAQALQILGEAYTAVQKDGADIEDEYVRVDTRSSKAREARP